MRLAIRGGVPVRSKDKLFPAHRTVGAEEKHAVERVIDSGVLSRYLGTCHAQFMGGDEVQELERRWAEYYGVKYAIAVNSASSGLICAVGAIGIEPGDEVIVSPWSMSISATCPLFYGGIPVFADVELDHFCLDPSDIERKITSRTKAIIVVDLFGQPYNADAINALATKYGLLVIEDAAQAPGASFAGKPAGTLGDIGIFSLNYHKHIHCGEGGIIVTNDQSIAERLCLIRNHAESVVEGKGVSNLVNMIGYNFRMTEIEAAIAQCQLLKLQGLIDTRRHNVSYLEKELSQISALTLPKIRDNAKAVYYVHACRYDENEAGVPAKQFVEAIMAELPPFELREKEGMKLGVGYVKPIYQLPAFQKKISWGSEGWPFSITPERNYSYTDLCPNCESLHSGGLITHEFMLPGMSEADLDDVSAAFIKVWELRDTLL